MDATETEGDPPRPWKPERFPLLPETRLCTENPGPRQPHVQRPTSFGALLSGVDSWPACHSHLSLAGRCVSTRVAVPTQCPLAQKMQGFLK